MTDGLLEEVQRLCRKGWRDALRQARVIGYSELLDHLDGDRSLADAVDMIKQNTRRYAKRQMTWFRNQTNFAFYESERRLAETIRF